ncbi:hypothetical protein B0H14DRAFT_3861765 [Mycena olivaceomarginata]|nr:hypothetical protein B0H14DRAFT_3861765 [Mycena olivaceomarginata]
MASTSQPGPDSDAGECRAFDKNTREECDCDEYSDDPEQPGYCLHCEHRRKSHLATGAPAKSFGVTTLLSKMLGGKGRKLGGKGKGKPFSSLAASSSSKKIPSSLSAANKEANKGMRPSKDSEAGPSAKAQDDGSFCMPAGYDKTPSKYDVKKAAREGLAVVDSEQGFELDRTWSHEDLVDAFTALLPFPFSFFKKLQDEAKDGIPRWRLAIVASRRLQVLSDEHPTGKDVDYIKGNSTSGFRNSRVFIVACDPIPRQYLNEWKKHKDEDHDMASADEDNVQLSDAAGSGSESPKGSPERLPPPNKRRLFSKSSSDEEEFVPPKKKNKGPAGRTWTREPEGSGHADSEKKPVIDLTTDETVPGNTIGRSRASSTSSSEDSIIDDPLVGNPYDKTRVYEF